MPHTQLTNTNDRRTISEDEPCEHCGTPTRDIYAMPIDDAITDIITACSPEHAQQSRATRDRLHPLRPQDPASDALI